MISTANIFLSVTFYQIRRTTYQSLYYVTCDVLPKSKLSWRGGGGGWGGSSQKKEPITDSQSNPDNIDIRVTNYFPNKAQKRVKVIRETRPNLNKNVIFFNARTLRFKLVFNLQEYLTKIKKKSTKTVSHVSQNFKQPIRDKCMHNNVHKAYSRLYLS